MRTPYLFAFLLVVSSARCLHGQYPPSSQDSVHGTVLSIDSVMAILDAYADKRVSADSAAKVLVDYLFGTKESLNLEMDAALRDAVRREMQAREKRR